MISHIEEYIARHQLLSKGARVVVGLSGGADSVALLVVLSRMGYECIACHCNFMLRGQESVRDHQFARHIASQYTSCFEEITFDTTGYAHEKGISIEMAARELRYEWFEKIRLQYNAEAIAVAHHRDDNAETLLLNLVRGTGIAGVTGMSPRNGYIVRPLLSTSRHEIIDFLKNEEIAYVTDSTNLESIYARNKIRLEVMPLLREINPSADMCLERSIAHLRESEKFYREAIAQWRNRVCTTRDKQLLIDLNLLHTAPSPSTLLFEILAPLGFNTSQIDSMTVQNIASGRQFLSSTNRAVSNRGHLIVTPLHTQTSTTEAIWHKGETHKGGNLVLSYHEATHYNIIKDARVACFDAQCIKFPLVLRHWQQGDTFVPFGMRGRKKVSDYFSDHKFSVIDKEQALLLCDSEKVLWIVGHRASNEARITPRTTQVLQVLLEE